jgi:thioredoxin-related protein
MANKVDSKKMDIRYLGTYASAIVVGATLVGGCTATRPTVPRSSAPVSGHDANTPGQSMGSNAAIGPPMRDLAPPQAVSQADAPSVTPDSVSRADAPSVTGQLYGPEARGVQWLPTWDSAMNEARLRHKPVMVDLYTSWCVWCKKLDSDVYPDSRVAAAARQFEPVRLDAERDPAGYTLAHHFAIQGFPAVVFVDVDGSLVGYIDGYAPPAEYAGVMNDIASDYRDYPALARKVKMDSGDFTDAARVATIDLKRGNPGDALRQAEVMSAHGGSAQAASVFNLVAGYYIQSGQFDDAERAFHRALSGRCTTHDVVTAHMGLVQAYGEDDKPAEASKELRALIALRGTPPQIKTKARELLAKIAQDTGPA